ncbi:MAG: AIPR family protein [Rhodospirillaceae bacterium]|nr:AIPR family protein [Rhodospirillaceae bacterium]
MDDLILSNLLSDFEKQRNLPGLSSDRLFEAFVVSSLLRKYHQSDITDVEDHVLVGGSGDGGLDAIVILVNGRPVCTIEDVNFLADKLRRLDVEFVFVQAKSAGRFRAAEIGTFVFGVKQFFSAVLEPDAEVSFRAEVQQMITLARHLFTQTVKMQENPQCFLYFASTGKWGDNFEPESRFNDGVRQLDEMNIFSHVHKLPVDAALLKKTYQDLERSVVKDVEFGRAAVFPRLDGVDEAYIGLLPGKELIELVSTDDGKLNRELFYDNVRDFQGNNPVNQEIDQTLSDQHQRSNFPLLNNGVTIVARSIHRTGDTFKISDFQIVNGCQTTHVLFRNRSAVDESMFVPVKLVATDDSSVIAEVIKATNRQTAVLPEALESLRDFHKNLEAFYTARERDRGPETRLFYERRSKQYSLDKINPNRIVTLTAQIKSFVAMYLNEPHSHPRYYGELLKSYEDRLFLDDHKPAPYYASGVALLAVEDLLRSGRIDRKLRSYKHHLLMLLRIIVGGHDMPKFNSEQITEYSLGIVDSLRKDGGGQEKNVERAVSLLTDSIDQFPEGSAPPHRLRAFTEELARRLLVREVGKREEEGDAAPQPGNCENGRILWYDNSKCFGFIQRDVGGDIFVHEGEFAEIPWHMRKEGTRVLYTVRKNVRRPGSFMAGDVQLRPT